MVSAYQMQVIERGSGLVVATWPPGLDEERSFIDAIVSAVQGITEIDTETIVAAVQARGVGALRTEARVLEAVRAVVDEAQRVGAIAAEARVRAVVEEGILTLKTQVKQTKP